MGGLEVCLYPFITTALEGGEGLASRPGHCLPPGKTRYPLHRRLGRPQGRSGQVRKISPPTGIRSPDRAARSPVAIPTTLPGLQLANRAHSFSDLQNSFVLLCYCSGNVGLYIKCYCVSLHDRIRSQIQLLRTTHIRGYLLQTRKKKTERSDEVDANSD